MSSSSTATLKSAANNKPWVEKYRPTTLDDIVHHNEIVAVLKQTLLTDDFPNLLLYGPPGTGKTSSITALARTMFGSKYEGRVLHLNASDERGIQVIRDRVRRFAQTVPMTSNFQPTLNMGDDSKQPLVKRPAVTNLKLVILDEADSMTGAAQSCLRRTMEIYATTTRFQPIATELMMGRLKHICDQESVKYTDPKVLEHLIAVCEGDLRQAITTLQSAHRLSGSNNPIDLDLIHEVSGFIPRRYINRFVAVCRSKSLDTLERYVAELINEGYTAAQFLNQIHDWLMCQSNLSDSSLAMITPALALAEHRFCDGSDEYIQLLYVGSVIMKHFESTASSQT